MSFLRDDFHPATALHLPAPERPRGSAAGPCPAQAAGDLPPATQRGAWLIAGRLVVMRGPDAQADGGGR